MKKGTVPETVFIDGWHPYLWICAVVCLVYARSLSFGFTYLDDNALILGNYGFISDITNVGAAFLRKVFAHSYLPYYRPILMTSFILDAQLGGSEPFVYHLTNIVYHAAASCLVFTFLEAMGYKRRLAFIFGMIFAVHPVLSQGVAWIPGRNDTILAVFALASFISLIKLADTGKSRFYLLHMAFLVLALFTKETAIVIVPLAAVYLCMVRRLKALSAPIQAFAAGWTVSVFLWYIFRQAAVRGSMEINIFDAASIIGMYMPAAIQFTGKIFFPFNLSVFPTIPDTSFAYGISAVVLLAAAIAATGKRRYDFIVFGLCWIVFFLAPSLLRANYMLSADFIEHRVYVPIIGFFILLLETDLIRRASGAVLAVVSAIVITLFAATTFVHIGNFADRRSFWSNAVKTSPRSPFAHLAMAQYYFDAGRTDDAESEFRKCLAIDPLEPASIFGLGEVYMKRGRLDEAAAQFRKTIAVYPVYDNAYLELGVVYYKQGRPGDAERAWERALAVNPGNVAANKFLAISYSERKDHDKARFYANRLKELGVRPPDDFLKSLGME